VEFYSSALSLHVPFLTHTTHDDWLLMPCNHSNNSNNNNNNTMCISFKLINEDVIYLRYEACKTYCYFFECYSRGIFCRARRLYLSLSADVWFIKKYFGL